MFEPDRTHNQHNVSGSLTYDVKRTLPMDTYMPNDGARSPESALRSKAKFLDSERGQQIHSVMLGHYVHELDRQAVNRMEMAVDEDIYDHQHYSLEELQILADRGQAPLVFNLTHTTVNWVLGTQRRGTTDARILAKKKAGVKSAERKTELLKHVNDANLFAHEESLAFASQVKAGLGWLESAVGGDDDPAKVIVRSENWRSMLWDSTAVRYDLDDARYLFRTKWMDVDVIASMWRHRAGPIERSISTSGGSLYTLDDLGDDAMDSQEMEHFTGLSGTARALDTATRDRVRVIECWFKRQVPNATLMKGGQFHGELFDAWSPGHIKDLNEGFATIISRPKQVIHCAIMTDSGLLDLRRTPYRHNRYPFTPLWGYRRASDGMPYGLIRGIRDIQRDLNRRAAKALHHLSTTRVTLQKGAVEDVEKLRDEAARPDGIIEYLVGQPEPKISSDTNIASAHIDLMARDAELIQSVAGVTDENMGRRTNATSGIAIERRQNQGQLATSLFFDNLTTTRRIHGVKTMVNIETFFTEEDEFRITDSRGNPDWRIINNGEVENAIAEFAADYVITEEDWRATIRQAATDQLLDLMMKLAPVAPQIVVSTLDLVIESSDVPKRDELVKRIREITGAEDPDADKENPTPEQAAMNAQKSEMAAMQKRQADAAIAELEAKARKITAEATKAEAAAATDFISQLKAAMDAAIQIAGAPAVAAAADQILYSARQEAGANPDFAGTPPPQPTSPPPSPEAQAQAAMNVGIDPSMSQPLPA